MGGVGAVRAGGEGSARASVTERAWRSHATHPTRQSSPTRPATASPPPPPPPSRLYQLEQYRIQPQASSTATATTFTEHVGIWKTTTVADEGQ